MIHSEKCTVKEHHATCAHTGLSPVSVAAALTPALQTDIVYYS